MIIKALWIALAILSPFLPVWSYFSGNWYSLFHSYSIGMILGIFSYCYFLNTLILSARLPFLDRLFGHDRVLIFHGRYAGAAMVLGSGHFAVKFFDSFHPDGQTILGGAALFIFTTVGAVTLLGMTGHPLNRLETFEKLKTWLSGKWFGDYTRLKLFHNITALGVVLMAVHVYLASSTRESFLRMKIMGIWAGLSMTVYLYHKFIRVLILKRNSWKISAMERITHDVLRMHLKREKPFKGHRPGQFVYIRVLSGICGYGEHPFTISSAPGTDELVLTIKSLGNFTKELAEVPVETEVLVDGPYGLFTPALPGTSDFQSLLVFIAGGIGITPFLSILEAWKGETPTGTVTLVWSCRTSVELFCLNRLEDLAEKLPWLTFIPITTRETIGTCRPRRIDREMLEGLMPNVRPETVGAYICGPDSLRNGAADLFMNMGVKPSHIHFEKFTF